MKKVVRLVVVAVVVSLCSPAFAQLARDAAIAKAETILKRLQNGQTGDVAKELDTKMAQALPEEKLKAAWPGLVGQFGAYKSINERREGQYQGRQAVELFLSFEKDTIVIVSGGLKPRGETGVRAPAMSGIAARCASRVISASPRATAALTFVCSH
jgi:hypothetical protein